MAPEENREEIRQLVISWVDELMEKGETLAGAASQAVDQLISGRKASTFLLECGPAAVANIWRMQNAYRRNAAQRPGERKVQPGALGKEESILESLHSVGDDWVRVGDMDKEMCREVQRAFNSLAEGNVRHEKICW